MRNLIKVNPSPVNKILENDLILFRKENSTISHSKGFCIFTNEKNFYGKQKKLSRFLKKNFFCTIYQKVFMRKFLIFSTIFLLEKKSNLSGKFLEFLSSLSSGTPYFCFLKFGLNFSKNKKIKSINLPHEEKDIILTWGKFHAIFRNSIINSKDNRLIFHLHVVQILKKLRKNTKYKLILEKKICSFCPYKRIVNKITYKKAPYLLVKILSMSFVQKKSYLCFSVSKVFRKFLVKIFVFGEYFKKAWDWIIFKYLSETEKLDKVIYLDNFFHSLVWKNQNSLNLRSLFFLPDLSLFKMFSLDLVFRASTFFSKNSRIFAENVVYKNFQLNLFIPSKESNQNLKEFFLRTPLFLENRQKILPFSKKSFSWKSRKKLLLLLTEIQNLTKRRKKINLSRQKRSFFQLSTYFPKKKKNNSKDEIIFLRMDKSKKKTFQNSEKKKKKNLISVLTSILVSKKKKVIKQKNFLKTKSKKYQGFKVCKKVIISFFEILLGPNYKSGPPKNKIFSKEHSLFYLLLESSVISLSINRFLNISELFFFIKKKNIIDNLNFDFYLFHDQLVDYNSLNLLEKKKKKKSREKFFLGEWFRKNQKSKYTFRKNEHFVKQPTFTYFSLSMFFLYSRKSKKVEEIRPQIKDCYIYKNLYFSKKKKFFSLILAPTPTKNLLKKNSFCDFQASFMKKTFPVSFKKWFDDFIHFRNSETKKILKIKFIEFKIFFKKIQLKLFPNFFWCSLVFEYFILKF